MILVLHSEKLDEPIEIPLPEDWYSALLNYQMDLGHKTLSETINHMLKEHIDKKTKELEEEKREEEEKEKRHREFQKTTRGREYVYDQMKNRSKKI